jgi:peptidoglycan/LPS O-acetylase OafA/YrhL
LIVLIGSYAYGYNNFLAEEFMLLSKHIAAGASFISNLVLWQESGYFDPHADTKPLLHLWSLGVEEQFYFIWPLLLWLSYRLRQSTWKITVLLIALSFALNIFWLNHDPVGDFYSPFTRLWELIGGALITKINRNQLLLKKYSIVLSGYGVAAICIPILVFTNKTPFPGWFALIPVTGAMAFLCSSEGWFNRFLQNRLLVNLGLISYPLYLVHWPLITIYKLDFQTTPTILQRILLLFSSIAIATLIYYFLEKPLRNASYAKKPKTIGLIIVMMVVGFVGFNAYTRQGLQYRHQDLFKEISSYTYDKVKEQRQGECFLFQESDISHFKTTCIHQQQPYRIVLWGDSQGAALYPGLRYLEETYPLSLTQFTIAGCGGAVPESRVKGVCQEGNAIAFEQIKKIKPHLLVIHRAFTKESLFESLKVMSEMQKQGTTVLIIGPTPVWKQDLARIVYRYWKKNGVLPPEYTSENLKVDVINEQKDNEFEKITLQSGAKYFSAYKVYCRHDACLTNVPGSDHALPMLDENHITPIGAVYIAKEVYQDQIKDLMRTP